jgi:hypothetical protein
MISPGSTSGSKLPQLLVSVLQRPCRERLARPPLPPVRQPSAGVHRAGGTGGWLPGADHDHQVRTRLTRPMLLVVLCGALSAVGCVLLASARQPRSAADTDLEPSASPAQARRGADGG